MRRSVWLLVALLLVACGDDDSGGSTNPDDDLSTYDSVAEMAEDLDAADLQCALEYEGLVDEEREVSLCSVNGEYTELSVWSEPSSAGTAAEDADEGDDPLAAGANWTVDVDTAETASAVAEALGGRAHGVGG